MTTRPAIPRQALLKVGGRPQVVAFTGSSVLELAGNSGKELWRQPFVTDFDCNVATPVAIDSGLRFSAGENHGSMLLKLVPDGDAFKSRPFGNHSARKARSATSGKLQSRSMAICMVSTTSAGPDRFRI